jgi:uncharacterized membrane protein YkvA (DUF1232 family)
MPVNTIEHGKTFVRQRSATWNRRLELIVRRVRLMILVVQHPAVPWPAKLVAACSVGYIFSPIQLIPTFIPVIGQLDDLAVLLLGMKLLRRLTPSAILSECESRVQSKVFEVNPQELTTAEYHQPEAA